MGSFKLTKSLLIAFTALLYLLQIIFYCMVFDVPIAPGIMNIFFFLTLFLVVVVGIFVIVSSIVNGLTTTKEKPYQLVFVIKVILIPFYIVNFITFLLLVLGSINPHLLLAIPLEIIIGVLITYFALMVTSIPSIITGIKDFLNDPRNVIKLIGIICLFIMCIDFVGALILWLADSGKLAYRFNNNEKVEE